MCLACEMDAWWFAEMQAAAPPLPVGERSTASEAKPAGEGNSDDGGVESPPPGSLRDPTSPQRGEVKNPFLCEETGEE